MFRYLISAVFFFVTPVFADWDDEDEFIEEYKPKPNPITYGGITIECYSGCGEYSNSVDDDEYIYTDLQAVSHILEETIDHVFTESPTLVADLAYYPSRPWNVDDETFDVYDWIQANGSEESYSILTYPQFLELAAALRRDARFYFYDVYRNDLSLCKSVLPRLYEEKHGDNYSSVRFGQNGQLEFFDWGTYTSGIQPIGDFIQDINHHIQLLEKNLSNSYLREYEDKSSLIESAIEKIDAIYRNMFMWCLENHQVEGIAFRSALEELILGDYDRAIEQIRWMIEIAERHGLRDEVLAKLYMLRGQVQSEFGLYAQAIVGLTTAIQKDPGMKEAYFERAVAYFELGQFDRAIEDYLTSNIRPKNSGSITQLGFGIAAGILEGAGTAALEFAPSLLSTVRGLGNGLWAFTNDPVGASKEFVNAAMQCIEYLRSRSVLGMVQDMVPELKELIQNYDELSGFQRGKLIGHVIGKYGMDILLAKQSVATIKAFRELKKANQIMTLEALASPETTQTILAEAGKRWAIREEVIKNGKLKINPAKQGKHIEGHPNYKDLVVRNEKPSIFKHPNPDQLIREYGGTGIRDFGGVPGTPGYKEIVDFGEFIGYCVLEETGEKIPTTLGKIHYAKEGVHIVPYVGK